MSAVSESTVPRLPRGVRLHFDRVRNAHVLLAPERAFTVDATAVAVLQRIDGRRSIGEIATDLAGTYNADRSTIARDVTAMIDSLVAKRVVEGP